MNKIDKVTDILKENSLRVTQTRISVATTLINNSNNLLSSEEIYSKIKSSKKHKCDQVSVYRILTKFVELGIATKSNFQGEASKYAIIDFNRDSKKHKHEHYFKCKSCQKIEAFNQCFVNKLEKELEKNGYSELDHHLEISGHCPTCTKAKKSV